MSSHTCSDDGYHVCEGQSGCNPVLNATDARPNGLGRCDAIGCAFSPSSVGIKDFYGKGKTVDTTKVFTYVYLERKLNN